MNIYALHSVLDKRLFLPRGLVEVNQGLSFAPVQTPATTLKRLLILPGTVKIRII